MPQVQNEDALEEAFRQAYDHWTCGLSSQGLAVRSDHKCGAYKEGEDDGKPRIGALKRIGG